MGKKKQSKKKSKSKKNLEARVAQAKQKKKKSKKARTLEEAINGLTETQAVSALVDKGYSISDARKITKAMYNRKELPHNWVPSDIFNERYKKLNIKFKDWIREAYYLFITLSDTTTDRNPYEAVKKGATVVYLPGYLRQPKDIQGLENALGEDIAYVSSTDLADIHKVVTEASRNGLVKLVGFSDGGKLVDAYKKKYGGLGLIDGYVVIGSNPVKGVTNVIGAQDWGAILEHEYRYFDSGYSGINPIVIENVGHAGLFRNQKSLEETAQIIRDTSTPGFRVPRYFPQRQAA